jgi:hypothetical protein
MITIMTDYRVV